MYLEREEAERLLSKFTSSTVGELKEKFKFLLDLLSQDDWTFVIKGHAMIEAAVTQLLTEYIGDVRLRDFFERLPLLEDQRGKVTVAKKLDLLDDKQCKFIRKFSELRNMLVHSIENLDFVFKDYLLKLDKNQFSSLSDTIIYFVEDDHTRAKWEKIFKQTPTIAIFMSLYMVVAECVVSSQHVAGSRQLDKLAERTMQTLLKED